VRQPLFLPDALAGFRPEGMFFAFWTEVSSLRSALTSVLFAHFRVLGVSYITAFHPDFRPQVSASKIGTKKRSRKI
jgi:hypothetical protein